MTTIAFDESGNTGADLLSQKQPIFVLASVNYSEDEASMLIQKVLTRQTKEAKFSRIKKSISGKNRLLAFLESSEFTHKRVKLSFFHKRYMVVSKIVDILIETLMHRDGIDLYKDGANIATANMHYYCMPAFCGKHCTQHFYEAFIDMVRNYNYQSMKRFFKYAWLLFENSKNKDYRYSLAPILACESIIDEILASEDSSSLDPAIPAFFEHCAKWGEQLGHDFDIIHDKSKPISKEKDILELYMSKNEPSVTIGYDRRKFLFPLLANGIAFGDSFMDARLQIADLLASTAGYWASGLINKPIDKTFWKAIDKYDFKHITIGTLWPTPEVHPRELGTDFGHGINTANFMEDYLRQKYSEVQR